MKEVGWDDLRLFLHVASQGGLAGAAALTGISAPTIGRRMLALERTMGRALFTRSQQGYRLAPDGEILLDRVRTMHMTVSDITRWHGEAFTLPIVKIAGHAWLASFLAAQSTTLRGPADAFRICSQRLSAADDLTFQRGVTALLPVKPETGNFAIRKTVDVAYAIYRPASAPAGSNLPWISIGTEIAASAPEKWVFHNHEPQIHTWTNAPELLPDLIASGAGRGVLPTFIGDTLPKLVREGEPIEGLTHPLWLAVNDDDRNRPEIRLVMDRLLALLKESEDLFAGRHIAGRGDHSSVRARRRSLAGHAD